MRGASLGNVLGLTFCDYIFIHLEGDKLTDLNYIKTLEPIDTIKNRTFTPNDVSTEINGHFKYTFCDQGYLAYFQHDSMFGFAQASANSFLPIMESYASTAIYMDCSRILYEVIPVCPELTDICLNFKTAQANEIFVEKPMPCSFDTKQGTTVTYTPTIFRIYEFYYKYVQYRLTYWNIPEDLQKKFLQMKTYTIRFPTVNQISGYDNPTALPNLPRGLRQLVFSPTPQYAVNPTFRGRMTVHTPALRLLLERLRDEFGPVVVEIVISNAINSEPVIIVRVDLSSADDVVMLYVRVLDKAPLYATLRFPTQMLMINTIQSVYASNEQTLTDDSEFESNVIIANAGFAAAMIGGGALSGIGQGLGQYAQTKAQMHMQKEYLDWQRKKQGYDIDNQRYLQQSMFDFQSSRLDREFQYGREQQERNINWGREQQSAAFSQQNLYQDTQNKFTKELVETNLDSDIRRARNAQQLAGFRTDATVSGVNFVSGRGGLGHPDAPRGASLPPRSASTQTNSPKVYLTRPTGYYTGPLSNDERI